MQDSKIDSNGLYILEQCREIEFLSRDIYGFFAEQHAADPAIQALWLKTAQEEQNHADQFSLALKMHKCMALTVSVDRTQADFVVKQLKDVLVKIKANPPSIKQALAASINLENYLAELHLDCVAHFEDNSFKRMFESMMASDQQHIKRLQEAYEQLAAPQ